MPFVAADPQRYAGQVVGNGHCVPFVQTAAGVPHTSTWRRGALVRGGDVPTGTCIATFHDRGHYENDTTGRSHAAVFLEERPDGLRVMDQWIGHPVAKRTIRWKGGSQPHVDDGDAFHVIEVAT